MNAIKYVRKCGVCKKPIVGDNPSLAGFCSVQCRLASLSQSLAMKHTPKTKAWRPWVNKQKNKPLVNNKPKLKITPKPIESKSKKKLKRENERLNKEIAELRASLKRREARVGFYTSREWRDLRYRVLQKLGRRCCLCFTTSGVFHVDHIKPRSKYPHLELVEANLQVLCEDCNLGKSNTDETDWREPIL